MSHERYPLSERLKVIGRNPEWFANAGRENRMGAERFITGKVDDAHHEGRRAEVRRIAEADQSLADYRNGDLPLIDMQEGQEVVFPMSTAQPMQAERSMNPYK